MSIKTIVNELHVCDICGAEIKFINQGSDVALMVSETEGDGSHRYYGESFDFCNNCQIQLTEAIINGRLKKYLWGK